MFWFILEFCCIFLILFVLAEIIIAVRNRKYQKLWEKEKAMRMRMNPKISRGDLSEYYVMFCKRNNCQVEF